MIWITSQNKKLIVVAGIYGAGKTTFIANKLMPFYGDQFIYLLPDEKVSEYGLQQGTPEFHHEVIDPLIRRHLLAGDSLLYETTLNSTNDQIEMPGDAIGLNDYLDQMPSDLERMSAAKEQKYDEITLYYLALESPQKHAEFVEERRKMGGSHIEYKYIENRYRKSLRNLPEAIKLTDQSYIIDNTLKDFKVVCKAKQGQVIYLDNPTTNIIKAISDLL